MLTTLIDMSGEKKYNKKLLLVSQHFYPENFRFNDFAKTLSEKNVDVSVLTGLPNYPEGSFFGSYSLMGPYRERHGDVEIYRSPLWPRKKSKVHLALNYISFPLFATIWGLFYFWRQRFDKIFVCQTSPIFMAIPAIIIGKIKKIPVYLWITDLWPESLHATGAIKNRFILSIVNSIVKLIYRYVDDIYISSPKFESSIRDKYREAQIKQFPYWSEDIFLEEPKGEIPYDEKKLFEDKFSIVFAGNIGAAQDFATLIEAVRLNPFDDYRVIIIGSGRFEKELRKLIILNKLENKVFLIGRRKLEEIPLYYSNADALILGLRDEPIFNLTIPSKLQTYLASGKPILSYVSGVVFDIVKDSKCGIASQAGNPEGLAAGIKAMVSSSQEELEVMREMSLAYYKEHFDKEMLFDRIILDI